VGDRLTYAGAGVDIAAGERAVDLIRPLVASTARAEVIGGLGGFGGLFAVPDRYRSPVLVAATDGVGTKLEIARRAGRWDTVGIDLVAMCVDDLVCQGAEPLFFLDYLAVGRLEPEQVEAVVTGIADGCRRAGCALLGGEMAEHPGAMAADQLDLAGFAVGVVERDAIIDGASVRPGDRLIGLRSPGLRSNGFSLVRQIIDRDGLALDGPAWPGADRTLADELLEPSVIYAPAVLAACRTGSVHAVAHVTGGGLAANLRRVLPDGVVAGLDAGRWAVPPIQQELIRRGGIEEAEAARVFNLGIGMVLAVAAGSEAETIAALAAHDVDAVMIGDVTAGTPGASASVVVTR
jgi:phosphoribosylformylglycinamidine cyclo-ligase